MISRIQPLQFIVAATLNPKPYSPKHKALDPKH